MAAARCPHCGEATIALLDRLTARYHSPVVCPQCGGASCNGLTPASLLAIAALLAVCGLAAAWLAERLANWSAAALPFAVFLVAAVLVFLRTPLIRHERALLQRNLALVTLVVAGGIAAYFLFRP
jgi:hypothetical protein